MKCVIAAEIVAECPNVNVTDSTDADNVTSVHGTGRNQSSRNEILFGINSSPPWYLVVAYALQVRVVSPSRKLELATTTWEVICRSERYFVSSFV